MRFANLLILVLLLIGCKPNATTTPHDLPKLTGPLSLELSSSGGLAVDSYWTLSVDETATAKLVVPYSTPKFSRTFQLTTSQLDQLRTLLLSERFFDLATEYGERVHDSTSYTLTIHNGETTIRIHNLMNWVVENETSKLKEPARALRVIHCIRKWFNDPQAHDTSQADEMVLDAVPPSE